MCFGKYVDWITEEGLLQIEGWARDGLTDKQIAEEKIGVSERTFTRWKCEYSSIMSALKKGKAPVDTKVENALLESALGYYKTIREPIKVKTKKQLTGRGTIEEEHIEYVEREVYYPPNVTAMIFWLKNRRQDKWRDKQDQKVDLTVLEGSQIIHHLHLPDDGMEGPEDGNGR